VSGTECPPGCGCGFCLLDRQEEARPLCTDCGHYLPGHDPRCVQYTSYVERLEAAFDRQAADIARLRADNAELRGTLEQLQDPLATRDLDPEHTIECHADSLPNAYRHLNAQLEQAQALLAKALGSDKIG
jgi:hypothetical protein